jgi:sulfatase maturation enzyme AslB (radical SAM superfamily)
MGPKSKNTKGWKKEFSSREAKPTPKKASLAVEGITVLDYLHNNNHEMVMVFERQLTSYVEKLYPYNGRIFRELSRYQFDDAIEPEAPLSRQNDPHRIKQRMLQKRVDLLVEKIREEEDNRIKVYSIIWNQLTPAFQRKVEEALDFVSGR